MYKNLSAAEFFQPFLRSPESISVSVDADQQTVFPQFSADTCGMAASPQRAVHIDSVGTYIQIFNRFIIKH